MKSAYSGGSRNTKAVVLPGQVGNIQLAMPNKKAGIRPHTSRTVWFLACNSIQSHYSLIALKNPNVERFIKLITVSIFLAAKFSMRISSRFSRR